MDVTVLVSRVVDPGPPAVVKQRAVSVPVPEGVARSDVAAALERSPGQLDLGRRPALRDRARRAAPAWHAAPVRSRSAARQEPVAALGLRLGR